MATSKKTGKGTAKKASKSQKGKVGRPRTGKRNNPEYRQVSAWIRKDTYALVAQRLISPEGRQEFSFLVESLLHDWIRKGGTPPERK